MRHRQPLPLAFCYNRLDCLLDAGMVDQRARDRQRVFAVQHLQFPELINVNCYLVQPLIKCR